MVFKQIWIVPTLATVFAFIALFGGYGIGVAKNHLEAWFSYISDGGATPPESCLFGEFLNLSAMFVALSVYIRHLQTVVFYDKTHHVQGHWRIWSRLMMCLGFVIAFGVSIVANVQETAIPWLHSIGALLAFVGGVAYIWSQVIFSLIMRPVITRKRIILVRLLIAAIAAVGLIFYLTVQFGQVFVKREANGKMPTKPPTLGVRRIPPSSPFFINHLMSTIFEWILGLCLYFFVLSYAFELRDLYTHSLTIQLKSRHKNFKPIYTNIDIPSITLPDQPIQFKNNNKQEQCINNEEVDTPDGNNSNGNKTRNEYYY